MLRINTFKIFALFCLFSFSLVLYSQDTGTEYQNTIEQADKYFSEGDYINAKASYQYAIKLVPDDPYAKEKLKKSIDLIKVQMEKSQRYASRTLIADDLFSRGEYEDARKLYEEASEILPNDPYAPGKIKEINEILSEQNRIDEGYRSSINKADNAFENENYKEALEHYQVAVEFKPEEQYALDRARESELIIEQLKANAGEYENALAFAEQYVERKNFEKAVEQLELAISIKPGEEAPRQRLKEVKQQREEYEAYSKIVSSADELYIYKDFEKAKARYNEALSINPEDDYVKNMIERIDIALANIEDLNQTSYELAIQKADEYFSQENYESAMVEYQKALSFRPDADYAQKKIEEINTVIAFRQKQDEAYRQSIARADKLYDSEEFEEARAEYLIARDLKPIEQYPKVRIGEIDDIIAALQTREENYSSLVAGADKLFYSDDYEESRTQYRKALQLFPDRKYPKDQITMINEIIGLRDTYMKTVTNAERLLEEDNLEAALLEFRNAAEIDPDREYPREKIAELEILIAERKKAEAIELEYRKAITSADELFNFEQWDEAKEAYRSALEIKPGDTYAVGQIKEIENRIEELEAAVARYEQYETFVNQGDDHLENEDYELAIESYRKASELQPDEAYPQEKILEANKAMEAIAAARIVEDQYSDVIGLADKHFEDEEWNNALVHYKAALNLKPGEKYPRDQIDEINRILNEIALQNQINDDYTTAIEEGDFLYESGNLRGSLELYNKAAELKPDGGLHETKINRVNADINRQLAAEEVEKEYLALITEAEDYLNNELYQDAITTYQAALQRKPDENYPKEQIEEINRIVEENKQQELLQTQYNELIAQGDGYFEEGSYRQATLAYQQALDLKPDEAYPGEKLTEIGSIQAKMAADKARDENYANFIAEADKLFERGKYDESVMNYQSALELKPGESYPQQKIDEINGILARLQAAEELQASYDRLISEADQLYGVQNYSEALAPYQEASSLKPAEEYPKQRIEEIKSIIAAAAELERQYAAFITQGDQHFEAENYSQAIESYQSALNLKPEETYPTEKITEINALLLQMEEMAERQSKFDELITAADSYFNQEEYQKSRSRYQQASELLPGEEYPKQRISEIDGLLASIEAREELDANYTALIRDGDASFRENAYETALKKYDSALILKPGEQYPEEKIAEINALLEEQARLAQLEKDYENAITDADLNFDNKMYRESIALYEEALQIKPGETYPRERIDEINIILEEIAERENVQAQYNEAIAFADKHFAQKDYENAILEYKRANAAKPDEPYPLEQVTKIEDMIAEAERLKAIDANYRDAIERADEFFRTAQYQEAMVAYKEAQKEKPGESYPGDQIIKIKRELEAQQEEKEKVYALAITKADNYFQQQQWEMAKRHYESAVEIKPEETYALDRLKDVNEEILKKRQLMQDDYDKAIADADKFYAGKIYDEAIDAYRKAAEIFPDEEYPEMMIRKILKFLSEHSIVQINTSPILIKNTTSKKFDFLPVPVQDRKGNYLYFRAKNMSDKEHKVIIRYGSGGSMNGGVVVRIPQNEDMNEFIVRISKQDKWFREDNDWLTMYPEGGDVEVDLIQISYSD